MPPTIAQHLFDRRTVLKGAAAAGALQVASPFIIAARGETPIRIGMVDPFTGVYAAVAQNELIGAKLAVEQIMRRVGTSDRIARGRLRKRRRHRRSKNAQAD